MLIPRGEGVETKSIKTSYSPTAGTAYITFDNVKVPVENTLGPEGGGIFVMLRYPIFSSQRMNLKSILLLAISTTNDGSCAALLLARSA